MQLRFLNLNGGKTKLATEAGGDLEIITSSSHLTKFYVVALLAIGCIALLSHIVRMKSIGRDEGRAATINTSGRQRMLSQRIESLAEQYHRGDLTARDEMVLATDELEKSHDQLSSHYLSATGTGNGYQELHNAYFVGASSLNAQIRAYVQEARELSTLAPNDPAVSALLVTMSSQARTPLLTALNDVVRIHQRVSEEDLARLKVLQWVVLLIIGAALVLEGVLIFRPMVQRIVGLSSYLLLQATTDHLTGVKNRRGFSEMAQAEFHRSRRYQRPLAVIAIDIDYFKRVNDTFGHEAGDSVLKAVGAALAAQIRPTDILGRMGGEEFAVILPETSRENAVMLAERLRHSIEALTIEHRSQTLTVTASFGVAPMQPDSPNIDLAMEAADKLLYLAKQAGRNCVR